MGSTDKINEAGELLNCTLVKMEEEKLKSKYPKGHRLPNGQSLLLQKRLSKGPKFFDSGDYQMAKQNANQFIKPYIGEAIPTPETVSERKSYHMQTITPSISPTERQNPKTNLSNGSNRL